MSGITNRGKYLILQAYFRATTRPTNLYYALVTVANVPTADTNLMSDLTEIAAGNGYATGGYQLTPGATDFDVLTEDDSGDLAKIQIKDVVFTASGGPIPSSGAGARYGVLTTDEVTVANRQILAWFDLVSAITVSDTQAITLQNNEIRGTE